MQLPIDVKALIDEATNIQGARETELSVSVYIDETAPAELVAHVRGSFASTASSVRMTISYLDSDFTPKDGDDIAILVAGPSAKVGAAAKALRSVGVPTMIVTLSPAALAERVAQSGIEIPDGDIIAPDKAEEAVEPIELTDEAAAELDDRMGRWIVAVCREKRLAFAISFPFMRRPLATDSVQATSLQNAGIGLVPFIPGADLPIMTLNQAKMVLQISSAYGHDMDRSRLKELAAVIGSAYLCRTLVRELAEFIPVLGFVFRTGVAYGGTAALGYAIIEYYEGGEDATGVANVATRAVEAGTNLVEKVRGFAADPAASSAKVMDKVGTYVPVVRDVVSEYAPIVRDVVSEYAPVVRNTVTEYAPKVVGAASDIIAKAVAR